MSRLDDLIQELCPSGVPYRALQDIGVWYGGGTPSKGVREFWDGGDVPWLSPKDMTGEIVRTTEDYVTEAALIRGPIKRVPAGSVAIVVRSNILRRRLPTALVPMSVTLNQDMRAIVPHDDVLPEYLAQMLHARADRILDVAGRTAGSMAAVESGRLNAFKIPIPPVEVQREIVRVLDLFQRMQAELEAELEARRQQYAHYRDHLLAFNDSDEVPWVPLGEVGDFVRGRRFTKEDFVPAGVPAIHYGEIYTHYGTTADAVRSHVREDIALSLRFAQPGDVVIAGVGETVEDVAKAVAWIGGFPVAIHDDSYAFRSSNDATYVSYVMQTASFHAQKGRHVSRAKVKRIGADGLRQIMVPIPSLANQQRIVGILNRFDLLVNDLSSGLPAELHARRQQYAHYRDRVLTFEEIAA